MTGQPPDPVYRRYALYYPFFHFQNDRWLKVAALYWPKIVRLVPDGYDTRDSETVRALADDLIVRRPHGASVEAIAPKFLDLAANHSDRLQRLYGIRGYLPELRAGMCSFGRTPASASLAAVHASQMTAEVREALVDTGLALPNHTALLLTYAPNSLDGRSISHAGPAGRFSADPLITPWVIMHHRLVSVYTSVLAEDFANTNLLQPTTDQDSPYRATNNWSVDQIAADLLGYTTQESQLAPEDLPETLGFLALELVVPANLDSIPISRLITIRNRYRDEFFAFGQEVDRIAGSMADLCNVHDQRVLDEYINDAIMSNFRAPLQELRREMKRVTGDAATISINVKTQLPAGAALAGGAWLSGHPLVAGTSAAAIGLMAIHRGLRQRRRELFNSQPAASFLLHTEDNLRPADLLARTLRKLALILPKPDG